MCLCKELDVSMAMHYGWQVLFFTVSLSFSFFSQKMNFLCRFWLFLANFVVVWPFKNFRNQAKESDLVAVWEKNWHQFHVKCRHISCNAPQYILFRICYTCVSNMFIYVNGFKRHSIHALNLTDELSTAGERIWISFITKLNLAGCVALCDVGTTSD